MKQENYNEYKISVDGNNGKFVITAIENKDGKLDSENENQEFTSEDEAIKAAKEEIDKKAKNKDINKQTDIETKEDNTEENTEENTITESSFDKLFNQILMEYNLQDDWKKVIKEDTGYETDPEESEFMLEDDDAEVTVDTLITKFNEADDKDAKKVVIDDIKSNNSDLLNDFIKKLQDKVNNPSDETSDEDIQNIQELIEYAKK